MVNLSIIVPVYNSMVTLDKCINSLLKQNVLNCEIILVDDGSSDGSAELCDEYSAHYDNIICIHQNNSGPAVARKKGFMESEGEYIFFLDSDDYIENDSLKLTLDFIKANSLDILCFSFSEVDKKILKKAAHCSDHPILW